MLNVIQYRCNCQTGLHSCHLNTDLHQKIAKVSFAPFTASMVLTLLDPLIMILLLLWSLSYLAVSQWASVSFITGMPMSIIIFNSCLKLVLNFFCIPVLKRLSRKVLADLFVLASRNCSLSTVPGGIFITIMISYFHSSKTDCLPISFLLFLLKWLLHPKVFPVV